MNKRFPHYRTDGFPSAGFAVLPHGNIQLLENLENDSGEDGYDIVDNFLSNNPYIVGKIEAASASPFTGNLINKYFTIQRVHKPQKGKSENKITAFDCPAWVLMELLSFGDFIRFYEYYYGLKGGMPVDILFMISQIVQFLITQIV